MRKRWWLLAAFAGSAGALLGVWWSGQPRWQRTLPADHGIAGFADGGKTLFLARTGKPIPLLLPLDVASGTPGVPIVGKEPLDSPVHWVVVSPDGESAAICIEGMEDIPSKRNDNSKAFLWTLRTGAVRKLEARQPRSMSFSRDCRWLAGVARPPENKMVGGRGAERELFVVDTATGKIAEKCTSEYFGAAVFSPDSKHVLVTTDLGSMSGDVAIVDRRNGEQGTCYGCDLVAARIDGTAVVSEFEFGDQESGEPDRLRLFTTTATDSIHKHVQRKEIFPLRRTPLTAIPIPDEVHWARARGDDAGRLVVLGYIQPQWRSGFERLCKWWEEHVGEPPQFMTGIPVNLVMLLDPNGIPLTRWRLLPADDLLWSPDGNTLIGMNHSEVHLTLLAWDAFPGIRPTLWGLLGGVAGFLPACAWGRQRRRRERFRRPALAVARAGTA